MTLQEALTDFASIHLSTENDWYDWEIKTKPLPQGVVLPSGNDYQRGIALKHALNQLWRNDPDLDARYNLAEYYVKTWGGVRRNNPETLRAYVSKDAEVVSRSGAKGVASWSKVLCIADPEQFAIFDARVSTSLNCLQMLYHTDAPEIYPLIASQNRRIKRGTPHLREFARSKRWEQKDRFGFYDEYCELLRRTVTNLGQIPEAKIYTLEMLLFAKAEELLESALKN